ncbi:MAG: NAD-glutamate dehydrogenase [Longimicrobiales bacterium]|nr:NAD-glutamate dehydrogenase [Longimicrobiales bacterium]
MSDTTEATRRSLRAESPVIDDVCDLLRDAVDTDTDLLLDFARLFLSRAPEDLLRQRSAAHLASMTLGAFRFLEGSRPYRVDVQVTEPEASGEGWSAPVTVIRTNVSERPFIIDSIREYLSLHDFAIERMVYPIMDVERDDEGCVVGVAPPTDTGTKESIVHCEIARVEDPERLESLKSDLEDRLQDVVRATDDFRPMMDAVDVVIDDVRRNAEALPEKRSELEEIEHFLRWLKEGGFVFLGYRAYDVVEPDDGDERSIVVEPGSGLGLLRNEGTSRFAEPVPLSELDPGMRQLALHGPLLIINKTNAESTVHRRARMDYVGVKKLDADGEVKGEHRFIGLFTSKAYAESAGSIPILRNKLDSILETEGVREGSHDYKEIITIFNSLPKEELFLSSANEVGDDVRAVLDSYGGHDVRVTLREDLLHRGLSVMVILPRERFSGAVRKAIEAALVEAYEAEVLNYHLALGEGDQARLHFYLGAGAENVGAVTASDLEEIVAELIRTWADRVREGLESFHTADEAHRLALHYGEALSREYQAAMAPDVAVQDILELEAMEAADRSVSVRFTNPDLETVVAGVSDIAEVTELKLFLRGERLVLSTFMPILEDAGLRVLAMRPYDVTGDGAPDASIYVFAVQTRAKERLDVDRRGELLSETILAARAGDVVSDSLNALVVTAGLHWREVDVLRGYAGYAFQVGAVPSRKALPSALVEYPGIARELFEIFRVSFDPSTERPEKERLEVVADIREAFYASLGGVELLADDRALRRLEELISMTVRTNYYRRGGSVPTARSGGVPYISYKFLVGDLKNSRPTELLFEVWVHSARMEGVHLRGSTVARGGIRWSDRPDDFRTEILGLVDTQMVKNAVIVPGGSKGGFITRRLPPDTEARFDEGKRQYRTLIRGLLDLTDNLVEGRSVPPEDVVRYDPPDPYLVVAADKGTATFSDIANSVSREYGFWLDDAFASGGSNGYDHKAVGITARGAWECVKRHFREKGKDIQAEPFTVVGIGDMSGDVFGNGMLLSRQIRLVAAFDHRHIFIDPDPDPVTSYAERKRMFELGRSSWDEYDRSAMSPGAMIVPRGAKEVQLTEEARRALGIGDAEDEPTTGEALVRSVLKAPVELLWNGGIGTYVKSAVETHGQAGDPSNDAVRVDSDELRCEVVGEGGNLGLTQRARIEYSLMGGRINTDALDNSGGVDMSDHEVNLKILLAPAVASGDLSMEERNDLLEELTESVAELVLENNRSQSLAISLDERRSKETIDDFRDLMFALEKTGELNRAAEELPSADVLLERRERGHAMARPELCVLLAYAKLSLKSRLLSSSLPDDPVTESYLLGYFPPQATIAAGQENLANHRLRREIITAEITNDLVDLMGAGFVFRVMRDTGGMAHEVVRAWLVASRLADHRALLAQMARQATSLNARVSYRWLLGLARVLERTTRWVIQNVDLSESSAAIVEQNLDGLADLRENFGTFVRGEERTLFEARVREIQELGADEAFSRRLITLRFLDQLLEILEIVREIEGHPVDTGHAYYQASEFFEIPFLRRRSFAAAGDDQWEIRAAQALSDDLSRAHRKVTVSLLRKAKAQERPGMSDYVSLLRERDVERFREVMEELKAEDSVSLAAVSVAARELADVADRVGREAGQEDRRSAS